MGGDRARAQSGQAIVLVALMIVVLFGFLGLGIDAGRAYYDRRQLQASVDAAALAAAYNYMNNNSVTSAQSAAAALYGTNESLYSTPSCTGLGGASAACTYGDSTAQHITITTSDHGIAGMSFTVSAGHSIPVAIMQVLGSGTRIPVLATATALARRAGTHGAAMQTLSPGNCNGGGGGSSLTFAGSSTTAVTGDVWSNGTISDNGTANGSVDGNVIDICPNMPPSPLPRFTVTGSQVNGWAMPDPGFPMPPLNANSQTWPSSSGTVQPGTYSAQVRITGGSPCYFMAGGVYDFSQGFTENAGFISNELRPPDEPALYLDSVTNQVKPVTTTTTAALSGSISAIPVAALPAAVTASTSQVNSYVSVGGQTFIVSTAGAATGATSIPLKNPAQAVTGTIASGSRLGVRQFSQFWDANGVNCAGSPFTLRANGSTGLSAGTYSIAITSIRWSPNGVSSCTGPVSATCYLRESAPSMCETVALGSASVIQVSNVAAIPGAQDFYVYLANNGNCSGLTYCTNLGGSSLTINDSTCVTGGKNLPDQESLPVGPGLPNANPPAAAPPRGDLGNEAHCVDASSGNNIACPGPSGTITPGAVSLFIPGPGGGQQCLNLQGGGDIYIFSGYQYLRILLAEPGPEQAPPANTCANNVAGHGLTSLIGIFYIPAASITITGNSSYFATIAGGVISWTATVQGNGGVSISVDPSLRTWPSAVRLTQ